MAEQLNYQINVGGNAKQSVGSIKTELREANEELIKAQENFGNYSKEAINAAKKVADLNDKIQEAKETADLFDPGKKFQTLSNTLSTVAGGFSAIQGAVGLFGEESKELEKQLLKVQSALALSQGLSVIADGAKDFERLATIVKTQVVTAFSTLRGALIATGLGALAISLGLLVANFDKVKKAVLNTVPGLEKIGNLIGKIVTKITDFVGITSVQDREFQKLVKTTERANETIDQRIKLLEAQGGKEKEIYQLQKQRNENDLNILRSKLKLTNELTTEEQKRFRELKNENSVLDAQEKARIEKLKEKPKVVKEVTDQELEITKAANSGIAQIENEKNAATIQGALTTNQIVVDTNKIFNDEKLNILLEEAANEQRIRDARLQSQLEFYSIIGNSIGQLSEIFGKGTAASKAAALAEIAIQTGVGFAQGLDIAQKSARGTGPAAAFAFPIFYATQVAAVLSTINKAKGILSTVKGGGSSSSASAPSIPKIGTAPIQPTLPQASTTNISSESINALGSQAFRAYVVETDVSNSQQRVANIQQRARFD